jgi:hypothetical protein
VFGRLSQTGGRGGGRPRFGREPAVLVRNQYIPLWPPRPDGITGPLWWSVLEKEIMDMPLFSTFYAARRNGLFASQDPQCTLLHETKLRYVWLPGF